MIDELREAYERIVDSHTEYEGDYSTCIHCNEGGFGIVKHNDNCIVTKANRWLFKNGKPELEG
jgi:hypothetical protein